MLAHGPRQAHVWLIFDVRQKNAAPAFRHTMTNEDFQRDLKRLANGWCERCALVPLRYFLPGYFALNGLTDGLAALETALKDVLVSAGNHITDEEKSEVKRLMTLTQQAIYR